MTDTDTKLDAICANLKDLNKTTGAMQRSLLGVVETIEATADTNRETAALLSRTVSLQATAQVDQEKWMRAEITAGRKHDEKVNWKYTTAVLAIVSTLIGVAFVAKTTGAL